MAGPSAFSYSEDAIDDISFSCDNDWNYDYFNGKCPNVCIFDYLDVSKMPSTNFPATYWGKKTKEYNYWKISNNQVGEYLLKGLQALTGNVLDPIFWEMQSYDRRYGRHAWMIILLMLRKVTDPIFILSCQRNISNMIKCSWLTRLSDDEICQILGLSCVQLRIAIIILAAYFVI